MKKTFAFVCACLLGLAVIGCGDAKNAKKADAKADNKPAAAADETKKDDAAQPKADETKTDGEAAPAGDAK